MPMLKCSCHPIPLTFRTIVAKYQKTTRNTLSLNLNYIIVNSFIFNYFYILTEKPSAVYASIFIENVTFIPFNEKIVVRYCLQLQKLFDSK